MRGTDETNRSLFSYVDLEERIPPRHPLRKIRQVINDALASLDGEFEALTPISVALRSRRNGLSGRVCSRSCFRSDPIGSSLSRWITT